ncbi:MAG: 3-dehydroquinate synthase [Bacillota bacterium]|nr:3-dehydroquinate synthase [Bacillota bacterium]
MKKLLLKSASAESEIYIERGMLENAPALCAGRFPGRRAHIVTDSNVAPLFLKKITELFEGAGFSASSSVLEAGETSKNLNSVSRLYEDFSKARLTRADLAVALGGGVIGDTAGFAAATYLRGINLCQIPTTLLAQVDSSVGGKCGVDLKQGKNLVGAFYQPHIVVIDPDVLKTLPEKFFCDGMAEVIKYGFIADGDILNSLSAELSGEALLDIIFRCVEIKRNIVEKDERDLSVRMLLNFGHTIGHAIEKLGSYAKFSHGQSVALGMKAALKAGIALNVTKKDSLALLNDLLRRYGLNTDTPYKASEIAEAVSSDKKIFSKTISFILIRTPGEALIYNLSLQSLEQLIYEIFREDF